LQSLPLVVGEGAEYQVAEIAGHMRKAAWLHARIYAAVLVSSRRWNLVTHAGVVIRLPEDEIASALARLEKQEIAHGVLDKDIRVVDLRFADRLILRLSPESAEQRRAEMKKNI
jgi:cell division protein FtsQ